MHGHEPRKVVGFTRDADAPGDFVVVRTKAVVAEREVCQLPFGERITAGRPRLCEPASGEGEQRLEAV